MNDILVKIGADISDFSAKMAQSQRALGDFSRTNQQTFTSFKQVGAASVAAGTAIAGGLGYAVKRAANFESAMSSVGAISGATGKDFDALSIVAREMGATTSFSAIEAAEGLEYMALAGWNTEQMIGGIEPVLHLAEAGALDLGRASDLVTDSMAALGVEVGDLDGYLDKVAQTSRKSNTDIDALMEAMVVAGGKFRELNVPLEESNAMLGVLANRGFKGTQAGTAMNAIMTRLTASTGPSADALKELGVAVYDNEGNFRGMEVVMKEVEQALSGMDDEQRQHYQTQIAGLNHGKAFSAMLDGLGNEYDSLKDDIINSNGALKEMRDMMKDNLQGALENLSSAFDEMAISLGEALLPYIKMLVQFAQNLVDWFNNLSDATKQKIAIFLALSSVVLVVGGAFLLLIGFLPQIISGFQAVQLVVKAVGSAFTGLSLPMLATIVTIGLVVAAIVYLWQTNEQFRNNVMVIWQAIQSLIVGVWQAIQPGAMIFIQILGILIGVMSQLIGWVVSVVASIVTWITAFIEANQWIMQTIQIIGMIVGVLAGLVAAVMVVVKIFTILVAIVKGVIAVFLFFTSPVGIVIAVIAALVAVIVFLGDKFEWLGNIVDGVANFMSNAWNKFLGFFGKGTEEASEQASDAIEQTAEKGKEDFNDLAESGTESASELKEGVTTEIDALKEGATTDLHAFNIEGMAELEGLEIDGIDAMSGMNDGVTTEIGDMTNFSIEDLQGMEIEGLDAIGGLESGVTSDVSSMASEVKSDVSGMEKSASGDFGGLTKDMTANANKVRTSVAEAFKGMASSINSEMGNMRAIASGGMKGISTDIARGMTLATKTIQASMQAMSRNMAQSFTMINKTVSTSFTAINNHARNGTNRLNQTVARGNTLTLKSYQASFRAVSNAINSGMNSAVATVRSRNLFIVANVRSLNGQLYSAGIHAMSGLRGGLNAGSSSVISTARAIASRVASTMRAALKVKSPSRVTMDIGRWTSVGLADGLMAYANQVGKASDYVAREAVPDVKGVDLSYSTPAGVRGSLASAVRGTVDVNNKDGMLVGAINSLERRLGDLEVVMDGQTVGKIVRPHINQQDALDGMTRRYFG